ncbi:peptidase, M23/M37 family [Bacillus sp. JCM 19046]|nr:peptidase, M23/M37 family [Bacillus sp. JCM 19045]GAF17144.1 peptidase, M23/M37 family [Bacillus sp. JCM 19046]
MERKVTPDTFIELWADGEFELIYTETHASFKQIVSLEKFSELGRGLNEQVNSYQFFQSNRSLRGITQFVWLDDRKEMAVSVSFDDKGQIASLYVKRYSNLEDLEENRTKNVYQMPINSEWYVFWGGTNEFINHHYELENQRYAFDLVKVRNRSSFRNKGLQNKEYYAFDQDVVAPLDGKVVQIHNGKKDNIPGVFKGKDLLGNYMVIEHANQEYSLIAHIKRDSFVVREGDAVAQGQALATCGNSGNSSEPHIHFQIMNSAQFEFTRSLRIQFEFEEPQKGDFIMHNQKVKRDEWQERVDQVESTSSVLDLFLVIRKAVAQLLSS